MKHYLRSSSVCQAIWVGCVLGGCTQWQTPNLQSKPLTTQIAARASDASSTPLQPEIASGLVRNTDVITQNTAVASANPLASQAGLEILQAGGSAVDAAIAVQMVLGLVEPQSSGIGGGAFLLHTNGAGPTRRIQAFDGRETAPAGAVSRPSKACMCLVAPAPVLCNKKAPPPMPLDCGSTNPKTICTAIAASTADPPACNISRPA
jgi:hypothetical protein